MRHFIMLMLGVTLGTAVADAADLPVKAPPVAASFYNWTGWYAGANVGFGWSSGDTHIGFSDPGGVGLIAPTVAAGAIPLTFSPRSSGVVGGGQFGYNYQVNRDWLLGAEADFSGSGIDGTRTIRTAVPGFFPITSAVSHRLDWFGTVRGRVGYTANHWLLYGTAGGAYGQVKDGYLQSNTPLGPVNFSGSDSAIRFGWTAGAGVEYGWSNWTARFEYLYVDLGTHSFTVPSNAPTSASFSPTVGARENVVRAALNYRFSSERR